MLTGLEGTTYMPGEDGSQLTLPELTALRIENEDLKKMIEAQLAAIATLSKQNIALEQQAKASMDQCKQMNTHTMQLDIALNIAKSELRRNFPSKLTLAATILPALIGRNNDSREKILDDSLAWAGDLIARVKDRPNKKVDSAP